MDPHADGLLAFSPYCLPVCRVGRGEEPAVSVLTNEEVRLLRGEELAGTPARSVGVSGTSQNREDKVWVSPDSLVEPAPRDGDKGGVFQLGAS